jgi:hypothetical protein
MNMTFALIVLISLTLLSTQAQNLEIEEKYKDRSLQGGPTVISTENLDALPNKVQNAFHKGMLKKDSEEENFGKIAKVRFKSNLL